jgi:lipid II:glycine glycyltransferase (peptidoglycan interpeptide bridge formation enzyme)
MPILDKNDKDQVERYNKFVREYDSSSLMQDLAWGKVKSNWKQEVVYIEENDSIIASMNILLEKIPYGNMYFMYSPRGPVCNVYDIEKIKALVEEADYIAKKYNAYVLKFDPAIPYDEKLVEEYEKSGFKVSKKNCDKDKLIQPLHDAILNIEDKTEEELLKAFSEKTRYNIRLSNRKGVNIYHSRNKEDLKIFYDLYKVTTIRDKIGCRPYEYFERMLDAYDENHLRIYISEHEGDKLSAAIATNYGGELFYLYGASSNEKRNLMPNYLMQWEMIKWGLETNCKKYNFGGILNLNPENGLYKFKTGFCRQEGIVRYIGEIDKVYNKSVYFMYDKLLPIVKKIKRKFRKIKQK